MPEGTNVLILIFIVDVLIVTLLIFLAKFLFRGGLGFRVFAAVVPNIGFVGYGGVIIGYWHSSLWVFLISLSILTVVSFGTLTLLNQMVIKKYKSQIDRLMNNVSKLSATSRQTLMSANEQASAVNQVTTTIEELNKMSDSASMSAKKVQSTAADAVQKGQEGITKVDEAWRIIQAVGQVRELVDTVNDLAEQSNLLAVNARIEAAKAGDYGRGFSVVASEVRNLAEQSKSAAAVIRNAIEKTLEGQRAIATVQEVIRNLAKIQEVSSEEARQISGIAIQQSAGIRQIVAAMDILSEGGKLTADATKQLDSAVADLSELGNQLKAFVTGGKKQATAQGKA